ncbi:MAG: hypothetical protein H7246_20830 [Phycisphaerae bacterium]|nr:hypothetical protein [Saprospiraceae bacterium]
MKKILFFSYLQVLLCQVLFLMFLSTSQEALAQTGLNDNGLINVVAYNGTYQDYLIPDDVQYAQLKLTALAVRPAVYH